MPKTFNMEMNIAKAIGILAVVGCHVRWSVSGDFFTAGSWQVPLFFFIAGYFFNINKGLANHIKKVVSKYLGWFYGYHFLYGGITVLVYLWCGRLYGKLPTLKTLTVSPIDSTPFSFTAPNWFLYQLAISLVVFALIIYLFKRFSKNVFLPAIIFVPLAITAVFMAKPDYTPSYGLVKVLIKTFISMFYIYAGWLYRNKLENKIQYNGKWLSGVLVLQTVLILLCSKGNFGVDINRAMLYHNISAFTTPFTGIYMVLFTSKLLAPLVKEGSLIDKAGRNTLHIMANHLFIMFLIEVAIFTIDGRSFDMLPRGLGKIFYKCDTYRFLYAFGSLIICTYIGELITFTTAKIKNKCNFLQGEKLLPKSADSPNVTSQAAE